MKLTMRELKRDLANIKNQMNEVSEIKNSMADKRIKDFAEMPVSEFTSLTAAQKYATIYKVLKALCRVEDE